MKVCIKRPCDEHNKCDDCCPVVGCEECGPACPDHDAHSQRCTGSGSQPSRIVYAYARADADVTRDRPEMTQGMCGQCGRVVGFDRNLIEEHDRP